MSFCAVLWLWSFQVSSSNLWNYRDRNPFPLPEDVYGHGQTGLTIAGASIPSPGRKPVLSQPYFSHSSLVPLHAQIAALQSQRFGIAEFRQNRNQIASYIIAAIAEI